jgi:hypothetical protein
MTAKMIAACAGNTGARGQNTPLKAPFPYFGGKSGAAATVWEAFGAVDNYVEAIRGQRRHAARRAR